MPDSWRYVGPPPRALQTDYIESVEADHGRIETRRYWITDKTDWFADMDKWAF